MSAPEISVCIPVHNGGAYIEATIESVLKQTFTGFELVICDNASTDASAELSLKYGDPRIRYVRYDTLVNQAANWNRCLRLGTGRYIIILHADDVLEPEYLERAASLLDAQSDVAMVHCAVHYIDALEQIIGEEVIYAGDRIDRDGELFRRLLAEGCVVNPAGVLVRRSVYESVGEFSEGIVWGVDWHMWLRIALRFPVGYIAEPLARYRKHSSSGTMSVLASGRNARDEKWALDDVFGQIPTSRRDLRSMYRFSLSRVAHRTWCMAEEACRHNHMRAARAGVVNSVRLWKAMLFYPRVWALFLATFLGYRRFQWLRRWRNTLLRREMKFVG